MRKKFIAVTTGAALLFTLGACSNVSENGPGAGDYEPLKSITVKVGDQGSAPEVNVKDPVSVAQSGAQIKVEGKGDVIKADQVVQLKLTPLDARNKIDPTTYAQAQMPVISPEQIKASSSQDPSALPIYDLLLKSKPGTDIIWALPAQPSATPSASASPNPTESSSPSPSASSAPSQLVLVEVIKAFNKKTGDTPASLGSADLLPSVDLKDPKDPKFTKPAKQGDINDLMIQVLKPGTGDPIAMGDTVKVDYAGWTLSDGKEFDSSLKSTDGRKAEPFTVTLGQSQVIPGWSWALQGMKQGEQALVTIPAALAYGDNAQNGSPAGPLTFYLNIVQVSKPK